MARDPLLRDAVRAIKAKIEAAAEIATPEELAYLGTAIDRIGGRATVLEVEEMGDIKMAEITEHANVVKTSTMNTIAAAAQTAIQQAENSRDQAIADVNYAANQAVATAQAAANQAVATAQAAANQAVATAQAAANQAVATAQAAANSVTQQLVLGRKTFFFAQL